MLLFDWLIDWLIDTFYHRLQLPTCVCRASWPAEPGRQLRELALSRSASSANITEMKTSFTDVLLRPSSSLSKATYTCRKPACGNCATGSISHLTSRLTTAHIYSDFIQLSPHCNDCSRWLKAFNAVVDVVVELVASIERVKSCVCNCLMIFDFGTSVSDSGLNVDWS